MSASLHSRLFPPRLHGDPLVITDVNVVDVDDGTLQPHRSVFVQNARIRAIEPFDPGEISPDTRQIDGTGKFLIPGLADMHMHLSAVSELALYLANGITTLRNMAGSPFHRQVEQACRAGQYPCHFLTTTPVLDGQGPIHKPFLSTSVILEDPAETTSKIRQLQERGYRQLKAYTWLRPDIYARLGEIVASTPDLRLVGHCPEAVTWETAIANGHRCFEHLTNITRGRISDTAEQLIYNKQSTGGGQTALQKQIARLRAAVQTLNWQSIESIARDLSAQECRVCPTLIVYHPAAYRTDGHLEYLRGDIVAAWHAFVSRHQDPELLEAESEFLAVCQKIIGIFHRHGVSLMSGTDAPDPFIRPGYDLHTEFRLLEGGGLSPLDILQIATRNAAQFMNDPLRGCVKVDAMADLVLLRDNPLTAISALQTVDTVLCNQFVLEATDIQAALDVVRANRQVAAPPDISAGAVATTASREIKGRLVCNHNNITDSYIDYTICFWDDSRISIQEYLCAYEYEIEREVWLSATGQFEQAQATLITPSGTLKLTFERQTGQVIVIGLTTDPVHYSLPDSQICLDEPFSMMSWVVVYQQQIGRGPHSVLLPPEMDNEFFRQERAILTVDNNRLSVKMSRSGGIFVRTYDIYNDGLIKKVVEKSADGTAIYHAVSP